MENQLVITILPEDFDSWFGLEQYLSNTDCPLARAIKRQTGEDNVYINNGYVDVEINGIPYSYGGVNSANWGIAKANKLFHSRQPYNLTLTEVK